MTKQLLVIMGIWMLCTSCASRHVPSKKPNILFIITDDLNDNIGGYGEKVQALTPNIDRLRTQAVSFMNAEANVPLCNPSRSSLWSGLYPSTTGFYGFHQHENHWWQFPKLKSSVMVFDYFQNHGYQVYGTGKIFHEHNEEEFNKLHQGAYGHHLTYGPFAYDGKKTVAHPSLKKPYRSEFAMRSFAPLSNIPDVPADPNNGIPGYKGWWDQGKPFHYTDPTHRDSMVDEKSAAWASKILQQEHDKPFFLTVGLMRPHRPQIAPKKYFDMYPLDQITLPPYKKDDLADVPEVLWKNVTDPEKSKGYRDFKDLMAAYDENEGWKLWLQSYLACVSFADAQIGEVLDALDNSPYKDNTIVVFTSDNGFHMGEKDYMFKLSVWDESNHLPLVIRIPGVTDKPLEVQHPVSLIDLYPTLIDLADLPDNPNADGNGLKLDGNSLRPFLEHPQNAQWDGPPVALSVLFGSRKPVDKLSANEPGKIERQHFTVRSERYRYTLTNTGEEELYDHKNDPNEWTNQAENSEYKNVKAELKSQLMQLTHH